MFMIVAAFIHFLLLKVFKKGDIFTDSVDNFEKVLFWTHAGFAYVSGNVDEYFSGEIYKLMLNRSKTNGKCFLLMTRDKYIQKFFETKADVSIEKRYLFEYAGDKNVNEVALPAGYELKEIDNELLKKISGTIVPSLF